MTNIRATSGPADERNAGGARRRRALRLSCFALLPLLFALPWGGAALGSTDPLCATSWTGGDGDWSDVAMWSDGVPDATKTACITEPGDYTVTLFGSQRAVGLTLGGESDTQTLRLEGDGTGDALLQLGGHGSPPNTVGANGVMALESSDPCCWSGLDMAASPMVVEGEIRTDADGHPQRYIHGDLTLSPGGRLTVNSETRQDASGADWVNDGGAITIASGADLLLGGNDSTSFAQSAGTITNSGTFRKTNGSLSFSGGTASGNSLEVESLNGASGLSPSAGTASLVVLGDGLDASTLGSDVGSGITVTVEGRAGFGSPRLDVPASRTNHGTIELASSDDCCYSWLNVVDPAVLTNRGTIESEAGGGLSEPFRFIDGDLTLESGSALTINTGSDVMQNTFPGADWVNNGGTITLYGSGLRLVGPGGSFSQSAGTITNIGGLFIKRNGSFTFAGGTATLNELNVQDLDAGLNVPAGSASIRVLGEPNVLGSDVGSGITLTLAGDPGTGDAQLAVPDAVVNHGTITLDSFHAAFTSRLSITGLLTNAGTIRAEPGGHPKRYIDGDLTLSAGSSLTIEQDTEQSANGADWVNNGGAVTIASGTSLLLGGDYSTSFTQSAGTIANGGIFRKTDGHFSFLGGAASGNPLEAALEFIGELNAPAGNASIVVLGGALLRSDVGSGITLIAEGRAGFGDTGLTVRYVSVTNFGTIKIESSDMCCWANLAVDPGPPAASLTNKGTIQTNPGGNPQRQILGDLVNAGTLDLNTPTSSYASSHWTNTKTLDIAAGATLQSLGSYTQTGTGTLKIGIDGDTSFGSLAAGTVGLAGKLEIVRPKTYKPAPGQTYGILTGSRSGVFSKVSRGVVKKAKYFFPAYAAGAVSLVVKVASVTLVPSSGPAGTAITIGGSSFPANDTIKLTFKDAAGAKCSLS